MKQIPFDLKPSKLHGFNDYDDLARYLVDEINGAIAARGNLDLELDYWHRIYEQDRTRIERNQVTNNGADLTSPLGTQYVDSLHARTMRTLFVEPIWTVEGWGESVAKAPFVEEFHQWTAEDARLQSYVDRAVQNSWIDSVGILEVFEEIDQRPVRKTIWAQIQTAPDELGQPRAVFDEKNQPVFLMQKGKYLEVPPPQEGQPMPAGVAQIEIDSIEPVRVGPGYDVIDIRDFYTLPGHARSRRDIWGYSKRFWRRVPYLQQKAEEGIYDAEAVTAIDDSNERQSTPEEARRGQAMAPQEGKTAEKELHEIAFLMDLDGTGERWWIATLHLGYSRLLRLKYDDLGTQIGFGRFVRYVPLPRKNSVDGFSVIGHKLITQIEEHTAIRNMRADVAAVHASSPIKVLTGALYDPEETPLGPGSIVYVRDMNEIQPMVFPDVSAPLNVWEQSIFNGAERTMGVNDLASGIQPEQDRTLGETQMQMGASEVRMDLITKRLQESMEELAQINHVIWKRVLASQGETEIPQRAMSGLEARGVDLTLIKGGKMTADLLEGKFRFKPRGSVETANIPSQRSDLVQLLGTLTGLMQVNPLIGAMFQTPQAARALVEQCLRVFRFSDRQAILGMPGQEAGQTSQLLNDPRIQQLLQGGQQPGQGGPPMPGGMPSPGGPPIAPQMPQLPPGMGGMAA